MNKQQITELDLSEPLRKEREAGFDRLDAVSVNARRIVLMLRGLWVQIDAGTDLERELQVIYQNANNLLEWAEAQMAEMAKHSDCPEGQKLH